MEFCHPLMETDEYKELFKAAKEQYPDEYEYFLSLACIGHLLEVRECTSNILKSDVIIDNKDEIQEKHSSE